VVLSADRTYAKSVFINCPFDAAYRPLFDAMVFAVYDCGFIPRSAQEMVDGGEVRIQKILRLIRESRFGIHDISLTDADGRTGLPRFNMPLELGLFLGAKTFGAGRQRQKVTLVLERRRYQYQKYCSDIAGQDISSHGRRQRAAIEAVRNWLSTHSAKPMPGGVAIARRFRAFRRAVPAMCSATGLRERDLTYSDFTALVVTWLKADHETPRLAPRSGLRSSA
jgi:hypothetical protein